MRRQRCARSAPIALRSPISSPNTAGGFSERPEHFPKAKVVLSVRDPDAWFESVRATIAPFLGARGKHPSPHVNAIAEMGHQAVSVQLFDDRLSDRDHAIRVFKKHIAEVQSEIPANRLLTFDLRDGWQPLCEFLEVEVPDTPFPKTNSSKAFVDEEWKQEQAQTTPTQKSG